MWRCVPIRQPSPLRQPATALRLIPISIRAPVSRLQCGAMLTACTVSNAIDRSRALPSLFCRHLRIPVVRWLVQQPRERSLRFCRHANGAEDAVSLHRWRLRPRWSGPSQRHAYQQPDAARAHRPFFVGALYPFHLLRTASGGGGIGRAEGWLPAGIL